MKKEILLYKIILPIVLLFFGACYSFILPPYSQHDLAWFGLVPLLIALRFCRPRLGFYYGLSFGIGYWSLAIWWLISMGNKGCAFSIIIFAYICLVLVFATFTAVFGMLVARLWQGVNYISYEDYLQEQDRINAIEDDSEFESESSQNAREMKTLSRKIIFAEIWRVPVIALLWVGLEYLRACLGFSWNTIAISQYQSYSIAQLASIGGTAAISFLIVLVNVGFSGVAVRTWRLLFSHQYPKIKRHYDLWFALVVVLIAMVFGVKEYRKVAVEMKVLDKSNEFLRFGAINHHDTPNLQNDESYSSYKRLKEKTEELSSKDVDVVLWPETSFPYWLTDLKVEKALADWNISKNLKIFIGGVEKISDQENLCYNISYLYTSNPKERAIYRKRHPVPFGEYIPFDKTIPFIRRFSPTGCSVCSGEGAQLFDINGVKTGVLICFEDTFSAESRESVNAGARVLVSQSNDMWFDSQTEKIQHHANSVFRAIETRTPIIRVSNEGYMGVVLPTGETNNLLTPDEDTLIDYVIPRSSDAKPTWYLICGDWTLAIPAAILVVVLLLKICYEKYFDRIKLFLQKKSKQKRNIC